MTEEHFVAGANAPGWPGIEPRWTHGSKDGIGTAYAADSRVWFTMWNGIITEVYYPTIDRPQIRDLQFLITDDTGLFHEEKRHLSSAQERFSDHTLGYHVVNAAPHGQYTLEKTVITDPHGDCVLQHTRLTGDASELSKLHLHLLCAPHLIGGGAHNNGWVMEIAGRSVLVAEKGGTWLALGATVPFAKLSVGYVGESDGWTDIARHGHMEWAYTQALDGNIALTGELALNGTTEFTVGLAFGTSLHDAAASLLQALSVPFAKHKERFEEQWDRVCSRMAPLEAASGDGGNLYCASYSLLLSHEDKTYSGALIASLSIPWGEAKGDDDQGGYHLVWTRDMVNSAAGLLAAGQTETALRALIFLAVSQQADGGFPQNFWLDGTPYWRGIQLDEVAFPILLAWRLHKANALLDFDPYPLVVRAASFLVRHGPATQQERWEEASGYSPSTLASNIAALICAAAMARERGEATTAKFLEDYADFLECHLETWTVTDQGTLLPDVKRHYIRILPAIADKPDQVEDPNVGILALANRPPGTAWQFPAKEIVDAGFLELVRYGIRPASDPLIEDSLRVIDHVLKVETPLGPCWRRYNHDGYGQRADGSAYTGSGTGRAWPLLTGERAHYELAAGRDVARFIQAMESFASPTGMLPEQVWDEADRPPVYMYSGRPTGSAMPLMWAHAEYIKLLRSVTDGRVFDRVEEVAERYQTHTDCALLEIWKPNRWARTVQAGWTLRIQAPGSFLLRWSRDEWQTAQDTMSTPTTLGISFIDIPVSLEQRAPIRFTFQWLPSGAWEGRDYLVAITHALEK